MPAARHPTPDSPRSPSPSSDRQRSAHYERAARARLIPTLIPLRIRAVFRHGGAKQPPCFRLRDAIPQPNATSCLLRTPCSRLGRVEPGTRPGPIQRCSGVTNEPAANSGRKRERGGTEILLPASLSTPGTLPPRAPRRTSVPAAANGGSYAASPSGRTVLVVWSRCSTRHSFLRLVTRSGNNWSLRGSANFTPAWCTRA
jgi:hypothetical protein